MLGVGACSVGPRAPSGRRSSARWRRRAVGRERRARAGRRAGDRQDRAARRRGRGARRGHARAARARGRVRGADPVRRAARAAAPGARRCSTRIPPPQAAALGRRSRCGPAPGAGAVRGRRRDAEPARRVAEERPGRGRSSTTPTGSTARRAGAAVRRAAAGRRPDRRAARRARGRAVAARRRRPADAAARRARPRRRARRCWHGAGARPSGRAAARGHRAATRSRCSSCASGRRTSSASLPAGAPVLSRARIARAFVAPGRRCSTSPPRRALVLAAASDSGDLALLERAAAGLGVDLGGARPRAEERGLVTLARRRGRVPPPAGPLGGLRATRRADAAPRGAPRARRRAARPRRRPARVAPRRGRGRRRTRRRRRRSSRPARARASAARYGDRGGGVRARRRGWPPTPSGARRLLWRRPRRRWLAGLADARRGAARRGARGDRATRPAIVAIDRARRPHRDPPRPGDARARDARRRGGRARPTPTRAVAMLADAAGACFYAGDAGARCSRSAERAARRCPTTALAARRASSRRPRSGMAQVLGGDAAAGRGRDPRGDRARRGVGRAARRPRARCRGWRSGPLFLREAGAGRLAARPRAGDARAARAAVGALPFAAQPDRPRPGDDRPLGARRATYREAIELARESGQQTELAFGLAGLAWLEARRGPRGRVPGATPPRRCALSGELGHAAPEVWATAALGELELGLGARPSARPSASSELRRCCATLAITDVDLSPAPELVDALPAARPATRTAAPVADGARRRGGQGPAVVARPRAALPRRCWRRTTTLDARFEGRSRCTRRRPTSFETARTRLAYGAAPAPRARSGVLRPRAAARRAGRRSSASARAPWADRARDRAGGDRRDRSGGATRARSTTLTPQELQIALLLAAGRTTREAAAALFLSPKTIEYHLRNVYLKLGIHSREELAAALAGRPPLSSGP